MFDIGDLARLQATFTNTAGTAINPTGVSFVIVDGAGDLTTYVYDTDPEVVRSATGVYYVDWPVETNGIHKWKFVSTGSGAAAQSGQFVARGWQTAVEPVTIPEAMRHLRIEETDPYIEDLPNYITAARQTCEQYLNATIVNRTRTLVLDKFPPDAIRLPDGPVLSITSIAYLDTDGDAGTVAAYRLVNYPVWDIVTPAYGATWPATRDVAGAVTITYRAGMMAGSPLMLSDRHDIRSAILLTLGDLWENREGQFVNATSQVNRTVENLLHFHRRALGT